jgi:alpha,alpha-trehalase
MSSARPQAVVPVGRSPLRDFAFLANGERGALIGPSGDIAWMCFPTWSDSALFAGLLDRGQLPHRAGEQFLTGGYYEERSLIWHSRFVTHHGIFESRDALVYPGSADRSILLRKVSAIDGAGDLAVEFAPGK